MRTRWVIVAASLVVSCGETGDGAPAIPTRDIGIQVFAIVDGADVAVRATLTARLPDTDEVSQIAAPDGDHLIARVGAAETQLALELTDRDTPVYRGVLGPATGSTLEVAFVRDAGQSAPSSTVPLPDPFELIAPPESHDRDSSLTLEWETGIADTVRVLLDAPDCVAGAEIRFDGVDPGGATIGAEAFAPTPTTELGRSCSAGLQVDRLRDGVADPAFGRGGRVESVLTRGVELAVQ